MIQQFNFWEIMENIHIIIIYLKEISDEELILEMLFLHLEQLVSTSRKLSIQITTTTSSTTTNNIIKKDENILTLLARGKSHLERSLKMEIRPRNKTTHTISERITGKVLETLRYLLSFRIQ